MNLPASPATSWMQRLGAPSRVFGTGSDDYELYEEDGEFVLAVDLPGFEPSEIDCNWYEGRLNVSAEHVDEDRGRKKTYHRSFRFPKDVDDGAITASYDNGVLEVTLPVEGTTTRGTSIPIEG